ncbi:methyltransferase domain-containing protein [bacterium]|nr:methyltransferase domain-containing protein [bacterium]
MYRNHSQGYSLKKLLQSCSLVLLLATSFIAQATGLERVNLSSNRPCIETLAGVGRHFESYLDGMNKSMGIKFDLIHKWLPENNDRGTIVDVGTGTGRLALQLSERFPDYQITGIDISQAMIDRANNLAVGRANLNFKLSRADQLFSNGNADAAIYSSITHEIYSYSEDSLEAVKQSMRVAHQSLRDGGRVIIRDFVKPQNPEQIVILVHQKSDMVDGCSFCEFSQSFGRPVHYQKLKETDTEIHYKTTMSAAYEYMYRKDYHDNWDAELAEQYGFWTEQEAKQVLRESGFKVVHYEELNNDWINTNRLENRVSLLDPSTGEEIPTPNYQMLIVGEKYPVGR